MAQETVYTDDADKFQGKRTVIDWDGKGQPPTYDFSIDGKDYSIDLTAANAARLQAALQPFIDAARKVGRGNVVQIGSARTSSSATTTAEDREKNQAIREWARTYRFKVSERGRIPADLIEAHANRDPVTGEPAANETAEREGDQEKAAETPPAESAIDKLIPVTYAPDRETYKAGLVAWAQVKGLQLNKRTGYPTPTYIKQYNEETGIYPPEKAANAS